MCFGAYRIWRGESSCGPKQMRNPAVYLLKHKFCGLSDSRYSARVMPNMIFFLEKEKKVIFAYVLEFMST